MKFKRTCLILLDETMGMDKTTPVSPVSASGRLSATKMSPAKDSYWFAHAAEPKEMIRSVTNTSFEKDDSSFTQDHTSPSHKSVERNTDLHMETTSPVEKLQVPPRAATPNRLDSYWFAHGGGNDLSSPSGDQASDSGFSDGKETSPLVFQREKKDEAHKRREQNEKDVNSQEILRSQQKSKLQINMDRSQNIESFISQKKQIVEERKGYIWDTEREQRDGILKQNYEQEAKLEARRNAQRNSLSFAFGNSALDNSIATSDGHSTYHGSEILFPIIRHVDDKDVLSSKTQDMSSYNLIQKIDDCMSRSMIINSTNVRGRRKTDLVPVVPWSRATVPRTTSPATRKEVSHSPARPRSSLSTAVESSSGQTQQPKVTMRQKTKSKPRPTSIAGTVPDYTLKTSVLLTKEQQRPSRPSEKKGSGLTAKPSVPKVTTKPPVAQKPITTAMIVEKKDSDSKSDRSISPQPIAIISQPKSAAPQSVAEITAKSPPPPHSLEGNEESISSNKPRIISEEEAKAALQEKRRLAREQAEREAELERQRQEEMRRLEEEKKRKEEEEQRRQEEEQLRLMEELKRQEEEKLKKAIEERERREEEEQRKKEEEEKLKAEREEQERKAREEAERQHKELEERLKREEAERAERKRRVEQIMSRTRGKSGQQSEQDKPISNNILTETTLKLAASGQLPSSVLLAISSIQDKQKDDVPNNNVSTEKLSDDIKEEKVEGEQTIVDSKDMKINDKNSTSVETTLPVGNINKMTTDSKQSSFITIDNIKGSDKTDSCDKSEIKTNTSDIQTNGYNSNEEKEIESIRSFERLESSSNKDLRKVSQSSSGEEIIDSSLDQVISLEETTNTEAINQNDVNLLNNADDINSNRVPGNPLIAFEDIRQKETSVTG